MPSIADTVAVSVAAVPPKHAQRVFDTLTLAFATDPPNRWLYPEPALYLQYFPRFARALGGVAIVRGTALACDGYRAAALWLGPDAAPDEQALLNLIEESLAQDKKTIMLQVVEHMVRLHPQGPHWYMPFIGVDPARQGLGLGALLLRPMLAECDAKGLPAYLESTNPRNRRFYERHGFRAVAEISVGDCPPIVPMLRQPRS
jgi:ribosomal protein S18 acetylase RimI-like enzyme